LGCFLAARSLLRSSGISSPSEQISNARRDFDVARVLLRLPLGGSASSGHYPMLLIVPPDNT
jgi:hypothetical protein